MNLELWLLLHEFPSALPFVADLACQAFEDSAEITERAGEHHRRLSPFFCFKILFGKGRELNHPVS